MAYDTNKKLRVKILVNNRAQALEDAYNEFARTHTIAFSQYETVPGLFTICIWYEWNAADAAYDEVKDDPKIMGGEENV